MEWNHTLELWSKLFTLSFSFLTKSNSENPQKKKVKSIRTVHVNFYFCSPEQTITNIITTVVIISVVIIEVTTRLWFHFIDRLPLYHTCIMFHFCTIFEVMLS